MKMIRSQSVPLNRAHQPRSGFTLVELLITVSILLVLAALTLSALNVSANNSRVPGAARDIQSYIEGARDRAIFRGRPVGVRFYLDPNGIQNDAGNTITVNSMAYVATPPVLTGYLDIRQSVPGSSPPEDDLQSIVNIVNDAPGLWNQISNNRALIDTKISMQIEIKDPTAGVFSLYRMSWDSITGTDGTGWKLTRPYAGSVLIGLPYKLTLLPAVMPNQTTRDLPSGVSINLESSRVNSRIPSFWYQPQFAVNALNPADNGNYIRYMDVMFTPSGTGIGAASGAGMIQLHIAAVEDIDRAVQPALSLGNPRNEEGERLVTISPVTGNISVAEIPLFQDANLDDFPDVPFDPYFYSELGKTAP